MATDLQSVSLPDLEHTAGVLRVLAHPQRLRMVDLLMQRALPVGELASRLRIAPHACSQHLSLMKARGVLTHRRSGRVVHYQVTDPVARAVVEFLRRRSG